MKINKNINIGDNLIRKLQKILKNLPTGKSAYDLAVENGFEGTMEEWLASLKGEKGEDGQKGDTGARGPQGAQGDSAIVDASDPETPLLVIANTLGTSTTKAMSQKGATDAVKDATLLANKESDADLDVVDSNGNVVMRLNDGHIKTQNFDSSTDIKISTSEEGYADLDIADESGNVVLQVQGGHIHTKNFHSDEINASVRIVKPRFLLGGISTSGSSKGNLLEESNTDYEYRMRTPLIRVCKGDVVRVLDTTKIGGFYVMEYIQCDISKYARLPYDSGGFITSDYVIQGEATRFIVIMAKKADDTDKLMDSRSFYKNIVVVNKNDMGEEQKFHPPGGWYVSHHSEFSTWNEDTYSDTGERLTMQQIYDAYDSMVTKYARYHRVNDNFVGYVSKEEIGEDASGTYPIYAYTFRPFPSWCSTSRSGYAGLSDSSYFTQFYNQPKIFLGGVTHGDEFPNARAILNTMLHICYAGDYTIVKATTISGVTTEEDILQTDVEYNEQKVGVTETDGETTITYRFKYQEYIDNPFLKWLRFNVIFIVVPIRNPWGYNYINPDTNKWDGHRRNSNEVDLNRNFYGNGSWYNYTRENDLPDDKGSEPLSEPENQCVWRLLMQNADMLAAYDFHAHGQYDKYFKKTAFPVPNWSWEARQLMETVAININRGFTESAWANHRFPKYSGALGIIQYSINSMGSFTCSGQDLGIPTATPEVMHLYNIYTGVRSKTSTYNEDVDCLNEEYVVNLLLETCRNV